MSKVTTISWQDGDQWAQYLSRLPSEQQDVYYTPEYYRLYEEGGCGQALCFVYEVDDKLALYPFFLNSVNALGYSLDKQYYDVQGAYGYNGIVCNCREADFLAGLAEAWLGWCRQHNVIAEFIRFNPVLENENICLWCEPVEALDNVLMWLTDYEYIWKNSYDRSVRNAVRKVAQNELVFLPCLGPELTDEYYEAFIELYLQTMLRNLADPFYLFSREYFTRLRKLLKNNLLVVFARHHGSLVSADLYLHNCITLYGFLSGTHSEYYHLKPGTFLRDETIKYAIRKGFRCYSIGGGLKRNDSIYKFKKSFSTKTESIFYIGKKVHDPAVYSRVIAQWESRLGSRAAEYSGRLLRYRDGLKD